MLNNTDDKICHGVLNKYLLEISHRYEGYMLRNGQEKLILYHVCHMNRPLFSYKTHVSSLYFIIICYNNWFNHISWVAIVSPTDHLKSVRNRSFCSVFVLSRCFLDFSVCRGFRHRTESDLFLFLITICTCEKRQFGVGKNITAHS